MDAAVDSTKIEPDVLAKIKEINTTLFQMKSEIFEKFKIEIDTILPTTSLDAMSSNFITVQGIAQDAADAGVVDQEVVNNIEKINNNFLSVKGEDCVIILPTVL
jgi:hypothetical protein